MKTKEEVPEGLYPMRVVTRMTGLTADTIRAWERRYKAIEPPRSDGNTRLFAASDVRRLIALKDATSRGHKINAVAKLSDDQLQALVAQDLELPGASSAQVPVNTDELIDRLRSDYLDAVKRYDVHRAETLIARAAAFFGTTDLIHGLLLPVMRNTGDLWQHEEFSVAQEHLVSMQFRSLLVKLGGMHTVPAGAPRVVVTTPEGHHHEFGALVGALLMADRGMDPVYLGPNLPAGDILQAVDRAKADLVLLSVVRDLTGDEDAALTDTLTRISAKTEVWLGLPQNHPAWGAVDGVRYFDSYEDLDMAVTRRMA